ncbi:hypothetical protein, partial [Escherichia coli]|uniref:hypothetical protein n=1 Tax=Escherichia coli TaxID=562 RepID=UPI003A599278
FIRDMFNMNFNPSSQEAPELILIRYWRTMLKLGLIIIILDGGDFGIGDLKRNFVGRILPCKS